MKYLTALIFFISISIMAADMDKLVDSEVKRIKKGTGPETVTCRISPDEFSALTLADIDLMLSDCADHKKDVFELAYCEGILNSGIMMEKFLYIRNNYCGLQYTLYKDYVNINMKDKCSYYVQTCHLDLK
jgi:hypothetical protein